MGTTDQEDSVTPRLRDVRDVGSSVLHLPLRALGAAAGSERAQGLTRSAAGLVGAIASTAAGAASAVLSRRTPGEPTSAATADDHPVAQPPAGLAVVPPITREDEAADEAADAADPFADEWATGDEEPEGPDAGAAVPAPPGSAGDEAASAPAVAPPPVAEDGAELPAPLPDTEPQPVRGFDAAPEDLPLADYDHLSLASLRARMRALDADQLRVLREYERTHADRDNVVTMFDNRIEKLRAAEGTQHGEDAQDGEGTEGAEGRG